MDYPISVPSVGLVGGKFVDEDPLAGTPGSLIPAQWGNGVSDEIINVIVAAGLTPDEAVNTQLLAAIRAIQKQGALPHGQCRLSVASTSSLVLKPYNGNNVIVNSLPLQLPGAGVTVTNAGLSASTLYYVYLGGTTASPTLSLSTTGHSQAPNGVETKTGDTTQTLVGMVYTNTSTQFIDSAAIRTCLNWFNRRKIIAVSATTGPFSFTNTALAETSTTIRAQFLLWADDTAVAQLSGQFTQTSGTPAVTQLGYQILMDGTSNGYGPGLANVIQPSFNAVMSSSGALGGLSEGYHYSTLGTLVGTNGGTLSVSNVQNSVNLFG